MNRKGRGVKKKSTEAASPNAQKKPSKPQTAVATLTSIAVTMLPIEQLQPSGWNPNRLSDEQQIALKDEIRTQGRPAKPIVVIPENLVYLIVDGEQAWRASMEVGLTEIPCEILEVDRLDAMRQTIVRNRHGEYDLVLMGRLYRRMRDERSLSNRDLARLLCVSEGTIRHHLDYAEAADLRVRYAPNGADDIIAKLHFKQIVTYLNLRSDQRDEWLDGGATKEEASRLQPQLPKANQFPGAGPRRVPLNILDNEADSGVPPDLVDGWRGPQTPPPQAIPDFSEEETFDEVLIKELEERWNRANPATRQKFLAGILSEPNMLAVARRIIKQGS